MAKVTCPNCKTEFEIVDPKDSHFCGYHPIPKTDEVIGELIPASEPKKSVNAKGETKMAETKKGTSMEDLIAMVMESQKQMAEAMKVMADKGESAVVPVSSSEKVNGGKFGKNSKYYGKTLCGFMYDPFMVARWTPGKFRGWMKDYNLNIDRAIKNEVSLMECIKFCIKECGDLAFMQKHDPIAFEERKNFWSVLDMKFIFTDYWKAVLEEINKAVKAGIKRYEEKGTLRYIKFHGKKIQVNVKVTVSNNGTPYPYTHTVIEFKNWKLQRDIDTIIRQITEAHSYDDLYKIMSVQNLVNLENAFIRQWKNFSCKYVMNPGYERNKLTAEFINGYKKRGAYYTMKDDIMFHGLEVNGLRDREAVAYISTLLNLEGYEVYKVYKVARGYSKVSGRN
ncbi:MAG: hypothetical protein KBT02_00025 [Treponema sp.]|nr:hypothetical protein [Candidatus Treponema caballi]